MFGFADRIHDIPTGGALADLDRRPYDGSVFLQPQDYDGLWYVATSPFNHGGVYGLEGECTHPSLFCSWVDPVHDDLGIDQCGCDALQLQQGSQGSE